jgi:diaminopimelate decarboxylase
VRDASFPQELARELLYEYGSPLYVYDGDVLRKTIDRISRSVDSPKARFCFASVTNGNTALLQIFRERGWGLHANTPGDVHLGLRAGFTPQEIVYSGSNLNRAEMRQMLEVNVGTLNLDSLSQLELLCEIYDVKNGPSPRIGLRLNLPELTGEIKLEEIEGVSGNDSEEASYQQ